jgi:type I restriction enzyme, S subunit
MSEWKEYKLGEIAVFSYGKMPKKELLDTGVYPTFSGYKYQYTYPEFNCEPGDLIVVARGVGGTGDVKIVKERCFLTNLSILIKLDNEVVSNKYLYYNYLPLSLKYLDSGSAQSQITINDLKNIYIPLPDLPTQTAIASILSSLDDKIELNNAINKNLEALAQAMFKQWFVDFEFPNEEGLPYKSSGGEMVESELGMIPKGWRVGVLDELVDFSNGYAFKSSELLDSEVEDCYHVFKMGHIKKGGGLHADGTKSYYQKAKALKLQKYVLRVGDLLMCMTDMKGNVALLGHTALMNESDKYIVNQRVGLIRPKNDSGIDYPFLYILTNADDFIENLRSRANSGVQVNLSTSEIKASRLVIPDTNTSKAFDRVGKSIFDYIFLHAKENEYLKNLRDTLLPKLISGELEVNEASTNSLAATAR